jgi:hypothetical protein
MYNTEKDANNVPTAGVTKTFLSSWLAGFLTVRKGKWWLVPGFENEVNGDSRSTFDRDPGSQVGSYALSPLFCTG